MAECARRAPRSVGVPGGILASTGAAAASFPAVRDAEIVSLLAAGDARGLEAAYAEYADRIHDYAAWMLRSADAAAAADVTQDTFLIALAKAVSIRNPERLRSWLYAVARNDACGRSGPPAAPNRWSPTTESPTPPCSPPRQKGALTWRPA